MIGVPGARDGHGHTENPNRREGKTWRVRKTLGDMLIDAEVLNEDQLRHFLDEQ